MNITRFPPRGPKRLETLKTELRSLDVTTMSTPEVVEACQEVLPDCTVEEIIQALKETGAGGQREDGLETQSDCLIEAGPHDNAARALALHRRVDDERLHLCQVFPLNMQGSRGDHTTALANDEEVAQGLIDLALSARQHVPRLVRPVLDQAVDAGNIGDAGSFRG